VINVQSSAFNSADEGACVVNLGVAPAPWIDREIATGHLVPAARDRLSAHDCPWTTRLHAHSKTDPDDERWWHYRDEASAVLVVETIVAALRQSWLSTLDALLDPDELRRRLREEDPGSEALREDPEEVDGFLRGTHRPLEPPR
jgi:hypothetical protein